MIRFAPDEAGSQGSERAHGSAPRRQRGVLLVNVGTPDRPDVPSVRRYLAEFLSDPLVIRLPAGMRWFQKPLSRLIARFRAPHSARKYQSIWTDRGSPMRAIMEDQASALASVLPDEWRVSVAMRYGRPGIAEALQEADGAGIEELVVLPMYPQFSGPTTGTLARELYRTLREAAPHINVTARTTWYDDIGYINAQSRLIAECASANDLTPQDTHLLFFRAWFARLLHQARRSVCQADGPYRQAGCGAVGLAGGSNVAGLPEPAWSRGVAQAGYPGAARGAGPRGRETRAGLLDQLPR